MELSPRQIGLLDNVEINQRKKQNGAANTELNQMQSEQFQQLLQEQKKYENECKEGVIKQFLTILNQKKKSENE